jgi:hypothetical protein
MDNTTYSFQNHGMSFNEKLRKTSFGKTYLEMVESMLLENQKQDSYLRFSYSYNLLEIYSITKKKVVEKQKKLILQV